METKTATTLERIVNTPRTLLEHRHIAKLAHLVAHPYFNTRDMARRVIAIEVMIAAHPEGYRRVVGLDEIENVARSLQ